MVNLCSSNPGTNIGKPVFMNDPNILFMLMFKSLFYSINTIFIQYFKWNGMKWSMDNGQKDAAVGENRQSNAAAAVGGGEKYKLFVTH